MNLTRPHLRIRKYDRFVGKRPSFFEGVASAFDLAGTLAPRRYEPAPDADALALASDWEAVGKDMWAGVNRFEDETGVYPAERDETTDAIQLSLW